MASQPQQEPVPAVQAAPRPLVIEEASTRIQPDHYIYVDHLRLVKPYFFDFKCFVKKRWEGKRLVELFTEEFPLLTHVYYSRAFAAGRLRVESSSGGPLKKGGATTLDFRLSSGMCVRHLVHRHEPPVLAGEVKVLQVTPEWVVVVKPASMPVHTVGQYRKNTVLGVLEAEHPTLGTLYPTYRLDKPVSGLLVLARSADAAGRMRKLLEERTCNKAYVARVQGHFPASAAEFARISKAADAHVRIVLPNPSSQPDQGTQGAAEIDSQGQGSTEHVMLEVDVPLTWSPKTNHASAVPVGTQPVNGEEARTAVTHFRLLGVCDDGVTSLVECSPLTGRTHQIRVHLQYLGFSIANDTQYGGLAGKPLAFRRLHQAVGEQQGKEEQHRTGAPEQTHIQALQPAADAAPQGQDGMEEPCSKRLRADPDQAGDAQAGQETGQGPSSSKRDELITAFKHGGDHFGIVHVGGQVHPSSSNTLPAADTAAPDVEIAGDGEGQPVEGGGAGLVAESKASLLHEAISSIGVSSCCVALPEELERLYRDPRYRVPADQEEEVCPHCPCLVPQGYPIDLQPLWLHAIKYSCSEWSFEAPLPDWALLR